MVWLYSKLPSPNANATTTAPSASRHVAAINASGAHSLIFIPVLTHAPTARVPHIS
jgi:hypothetical protein